MRILSLLPAATEIVYLLGLEKNLVGVSHECDFPKQAQKLPKVTSSPISNALSSAEINSQVAKLKHKGSGVFHIDESLLIKLKPDLILTQEICDVCAISWTKVKKAARALTHPVILTLSERSESKGKNLNIISLEPESIGDILENIKLVGEASDQWPESRKVIKSLKSRLKLISSKLDINHQILKRVQDNNKGKPKVLIIEWLEPLMVAAHWVPEMVTIAGGNNLISQPGQRSIRISLDQIVNSLPDIIIFAPCGFNIARTLKERFLIDDLLSKIGCTRLKVGKDIKFYLLDGNAYLTRPGPRIIDGVEILSEILHPAIFRRKHSLKDWKSLI